LEPVVVPPDPRLKAGFDLRDLGGFAFFKDGLKFFAGGGGVGFVHDPPCFSGVIMAATFAKEKRNRIKPLSFFHMFLIFASCSLGQQCGCPIRIFVRDVVLVQCGVLREFSSARRDRLRTPVPASPCRSRVASASRPTPGVKSAGRVLA
jgi:hypothetical protein